MKNLAIYCEFRDPDEEVRDSLVATCIDNQLKKKLLSEKNLTLEKVLSMGKEFEVVLAQVAEMDSTKQKDSEASVETVMKINNRGKYNKYRNERGQNNHLSKSCFKCGQKFVKGHLENCPAIGRNCGKHDHLSKVCRSSKQVQSKQRFGIPEIQNRVIKPSYA